MSNTAKITFGLCCSVSFGIIGYVHYRQEYDRRQLHLGVVRDIERQERKKLENTYLLVKQNELRKVLERAQAEEDRAKLS